MDLKVKLTALYILYSYQPATLRYLFVRNKLLTCIASISSSARCGPFLRLFRRSVLVIRVNSAKTAEPIDMPFWGGADLRRPKEPFDGTTYGRCLTNAIEQLSMLGDVGCRYHNSVAAC